jgi:drug/metabolite transporter (DMT)-like permease
MRTGIEPWVIVKTIMSACGQVVGFFSLYGLVRSFPSVCLAVLALVSPIVGGIVWLLLNKSNGWPFYLGGPNNERLLKWIQ